MARKCIRLAPINLFRCVFVILQRSHYVAVDACLKIYFVLSHCFNYFVLISTILVLIFYEFFYFETSQQSEPRVLSKHSEFMLPVRGKYCEISIMRTKVLLVFIIVCSKRDMVG